VHIIQTKAETEARARPSRTKRIIVTPQSEQVAGLFRPFYSRFVPTVKPENDVMFR
jgi:hypothetical protein